MPSRAPAHAHLLGSKWTSTAPLLGWRQFHVIATRRGADGWHVELVASVDPSVRTWVTVRTLRDRSAFSPGWATLAELRRGDALRDTERRS